MLDAFMVSQKNGGITKFLNLPLSSKCMIFKTLLKALPLSIIIISLCSLPYYDSAFRIR